MKKYLHLLLALLFTGIVQYSCCQSHNAQHLIKKLEHEAKEYFKAGEYLAALPLYLRLDSLSPANALYAFRIGVCYFNTFGKARCLPYFQKAKQAQYSDPDLDLYLAHACHLNHRFDEAIARFICYRDSIRHGEASHGALRPDKYDIERAIRMCNVGKELMSDSLDLVIENLGPQINSSFPEYVPVITADEHMLVFTSRRASTTGGMVDRWDNHYYEDIYVSYKDSNGHWMHPRSISDNVNSEFHEAGIGLSPDGHKLFIYHAKDGSAGIYISRLRGTTWTKPERMDNGINSESWEASATIASDEKTIFFSSDRPGGFGGMDIWYMKLKADSTWSEPVNMGSRINSVYDEDAPCIHPDNKTLFFSSNGHQSMGGYDIFTSEYNDSTGQWSEPENAGYPINTADDELYFIWSADGTKGYFSAWRPDSYGEKDLYMIHRPEGNSNVLVLKGNIYDRESRQPVEADITITNNETHEKAVFHSNSSTGRYVVVLPHGIHYGISVEAEGYLFHSENFDIHLHNPFFEIRKDLFMEHVRPGSSVTLKNIFFDFGKTSFKESSRTELEKLYSLLTEHPSIKVEIAGYSDEKEKEKFHRQLSERRAEAVVDYLVKKGIDKTRLTAKGEEKAEQKNDNEEGNKGEQYRRTELTIIE